MRLILLTTQNTSRILAHMKPIIKTLSVRVRDKHASVLNRMAFDVNQVWNAANADCAEYSWVAIPGVGV